MASTESSNTMSFQTLYMYIYLSILKVYFENGIVCQKLPEHLPLHLRLIQLISYKKKKSATSSSEENLCQSENQKPRSILQHRIKYVNILK